MHTKLLKRLFSHVKFQKLYFYKDLNPSTLYGVIKDVEDYKNFVPMCIESKIIKKNTEDNFDALLEINYKFFTDSYVSSVDCFKNENNPTVYKITSDSIEKSFFKYLKSEWVFYSKDGGCEIDYKIEFSFTNSMYNTITNPLKNFIASTTLSSMVMEAKKRELLLKNKRQEKLVMNLLKIEWLFEFLIENNLFGLEKEVREFIRFESFKRKIISLIDYFEDKEDLNNNFGPCLPLLEELCFRYKTIDYTK